MKIGQFISFEGGEGGGKSTQIKMLAEKLEAQNIKVILTREPGGSQGAEALRQLLLTGDISNWSALSEALLFAAGRSDHLEKLIRPNLAKGVWVLCDRFLDSTRAYQGVAGNVAKEMIDMIEKYVVQDTLPNRTYILDLDPEIGLTRANNRMSDQQSVKGLAEDRFENMQMQFHKDLRKSFLNIATQEPNRCLVINAAQTITQIHDDIMKDAKIFIEKNRV